MTIIVNTLAEQIEFMDEVGELDEAAWPRFLTQGNLKSWGVLYDQLIDYSIVLSESNRVIAAGFTVPTLWDGTLEQLPSSLEQLIQQGLTCYQHPGLANTLMPIAVLVHPNHRGLGLSQQLLLEMKKLALHLKLKQFVVPVRPALKSHYPLQDIHRYAKWRRKDGQLFDPWLRTHEKLGATILKVNENMVTVEGNLTDWTLWTKHHFPESGKYIIPDALNPIDIDVQANKARYEEPNIWMLHPMST